MYERDHVPLLGELIERYALPLVEVVITDPGRGSGGLFTRLLQAQGFVLETPLPLATLNLPADTPRVLHFRRRHPPMPGNLR